MRSTLLHDRQIKLSKAQVHVYSNSVLCLRKMHGLLEAMAKWKEQLHYAIEFEWNTSQDLQLWRFFN